MLNKEKTFQTNWFDAYLRWANIKISLHQLDSNVLQQNKEFNYI